MKKIIFIISILATCASVSAQVQNQYVNHDEFISLRNNLQHIDAKVESLKAEQNTTNKVLQFQEKSIDSLTNVNNKLTQNYDSLRNKISVLSQKQSDDNALFTQNIQEANGSIIATNDAVTIRTLWAIVITVIILALIAIIVFVITKKIKHSASSISDVRAAQDALQKAQLKMQEESIALDSKLADIISKQLEGKPSPSNGDIDHSLALKVADEIVRMELNLSRMDSSIKGHKQLSKAVERIRNNFSANGYEIVDMLGKPYNEGMKVVANFVVDESLKDGEQIISSITKPQVNYNGTMIQAAQITVSQNI